MSQPSLKAPKSGKPVDRLSVADAREELRFLAEEIARHNALYHGQDRPEISDAEFDALTLVNSAIEDLFPELKRDDSPSLTVGAAPSQRFDKVTHAQPMLSLGNAFSPEDVADFVGRIQRFLGLDEQETLNFTAETENRRPVRQPALSGW